MTPLAPRLGYAANDTGARDRYRYTTEPWRQWYASRRWKALRQQILIRDSYTCAKCNHVIAVPGEAICDHITPHRGDPQRFWSGPFQTLCKSCHDTVKQNEELAGRRGMGW